jgi:hypothetical protein
MPPAPCIISSFEGSKAKRYLKMSRTRRILSRGSRICRRRWMWLQSAGIDLSAVIAAACRYLGIEEKELARRFNEDHSALSQATQRVSRDPELLSATKTIQREPELEGNQHLSNVPFSPFISYHHQLLFLFFLAPLNLPVATVFYFLSLIF